MRLSGALAVVAGSILALVAAASAAYTGISGRVVNGTAGAAQPSGLEVSVVQLDSSRKQVARKTVLADAAGSFSLGDMEASPGSQFLIATTYLGVTYSTVAGEGDDLRAVQLKVFETIDDDSVIDVVSDTVTVVRGEKDELEVLQVLRLRNNSDRTYIGRPSPDGGSPSTVRLPLPAGAFDVSLSDTLKGGGVGSAPEGMTSTEPILPGERTFSYAYKVRVPRSGWPLRRPVVYPTAKVDLLIDDGLRLTAPGFRMEDQPNLGGKSYRRYRRGPFVAGSVLGADVLYPDSSSGAGRIIALGVGGSAALLLGLAILIRRRSRRNEPASREALIDRIARLDQAFAAGEMKESTYRARRDRMKAELVELTERVTADRQ